MTVSGALRSPRLVLFGAGQRRALGDVVRQLGQRAFICTDPRFSEDKNLVELADNVRKAGVTVEVYDKTIAELPLDCINEATAQARKFGPDVIIGLGGGSCLDIAKLVALQLAHKGAMSDFYGEFKVPGPVMPLVAVPTTAGTGSEATPVAVLGDPDREMKIGVSSPYLIPVAAICDAELTLTCPPKLTAIAGADALTHAIEAFTALRRPAEPGIALQHVFIGKNALSDASASVAITALAANLVTAVERGNDIAAREQVMLGAFAAGQSFGVAGTAAAHAIQYPVGALTHTAHGLGVAALMPYVMEFNRPNCTPELAQIARMIGVAKDTDENALAGQAIDAIDGIFQRIGIPRTLKELGLAEDRIEWVAEKTLLSQRLTKNNPRSIDQDAALRITKAAFYGDRASLRDR
jgi:alcohol dehydrogenase